MDAQIKNEYLRWLENARADEDVVTELENLANNEKQLEDAFYRELEFGTGGLRGVIGAGTNRMNYYTVAKASQGLCDYITENFPKDKRRIAVSYDSRIKSDYFARVSAQVFAANSIEVFIYPRLMPTPCLSFAVRELSCSAGIMITASHNPAKYNGYKVYGSDGCQITTKAADEILEKIKKLDIFNDIKYSDFDEQIKKGIIKYIPDEVLTAYIETVKAQSMLFGEQTDKTLSIVYTPLNGSGLEPVKRALTESGYTNITVVKQQEKPDGNFTTCPYPNPEIKEALALGLEYAKKHNADLLLATDPDCDRVGIAVKNKNGEHVLLTGNEVGVLLFDYICSQRLKNNAMPENPIMVKTIVTTDMGELAARHYGVKTVNVLTGFKFIGEQIGVLEERGQKDSYIFGFEESYGYLSGTYVRDKDAVNAAFLICEMFAYYAKYNIGLCDKLEELYNTYGYCLNTLHSYEFEGAEGFCKMQDIMARFRTQAKTFGEKSIEALYDYANGIDGLPKSDVLKFVLSDGCSLIVRPSGTEPKIKTYICVCAETREKAQEIENSIKNSVEEMML